MILLSTCAAVNVFGDCIGAAIVDHWEAKKVDDIDMEEGEFSSSSKHGSSTSSLGTLALAPEAEQCGRVYSLKPILYAAEDSDITSPFLSPERAYPRYQTTQVS